MLKVKHIFIACYLLLATCCSVSAQLIDTTALMAQPIFDNLTEALKNPSQVFRLSLRGKKLKKFPMEILQFKNLQELDLSKNKLDSIPGLIGTLPYLETLDLSNNKINYLPDSIGLLKNLKKLVAFKNNLIALPTEIGKLESLEILDLWSNEFSFFPEELSKLKKLRWMDLRNITIEDNQQERLQKLLPKAKIFFSPSCHCVSG
ncbi:MAG TPA: leucine-rich repeat domain-containing protein [Bacteroidia bacterium]